MSGSPSMSVWMSAHCGAAAPRRDGAVLVVLGRDGHGLVVDAASHPCVGHLIDDVMASGSGAEAEAAGPTPASVGPIRLTVSDGVAPQPTVVRDPYRTAVPRAEGVVYGTVLSQRETEILVLICQGLTNQDIADRLFLSINSVKTYIRSCYRKIGVTRRSQALRWGFLNGMGAAAGTGL